MKKYRSNVGKIAKKNKNVLEQKSVTKLVFLIAGLLTILFLIVIMAGGEGITGISGALARIIRFFILIILAYIVVNWSFSITEETEVFEESKEFDTDRNLQIEEISTLLERASDGKTRSQEVLHNNIKDIFFIKLKEKEGLSKNELRGMVKKPEKFRSIVQNDMISDFILSLEEENESNSDLEKMDKVQYKKMIRKIIQEISEWD
ncbi:MAG: hypothetical protein V5A66_03930 [Candidatus Thermoplasmatota archaeon]